MVNGRQLMTNWLRPTNQPIPRSLGSLLLLPAKTNTNNTQGQKFNCILLNPRQIFLRPQSSMVQVDSVVGSNIATSVVCSKPVWLNFCMEWIANPPKLSPANKFFLKGTCMHTDTHIHVYICGVVLPNPIQHFHHYAFSKGAVIGWVLWSCMIVLHGMCFTLVCEWRSASGSVMDEDSHHQLSSLDYFKANNFYFAFSPIYFWSREVL